MNYEKQEYFPDFGAEAVLEPGQMIIWEAALAHLEEKLTYLIERAKYYADVPENKERFCEVIEDLQARAKTIRRTNQGER